MQNTWLTQTKLFSPRLCGKKPSRSRLLDILRSAINSCAPILLSAPVGYVKTTLLASFSDKLVAWISLDGEDNNLLRFCMALVLESKKLDTNFWENNHVFFISWDINCPIPNIYRYTLQQER